MRFEDYLNQCLKDSEFKAYWEELHSDNITSIEEALKLLKEYSEDDKEYIIQSKGLKGKSIKDSDIEFYQLDSGRCPVSDFLSSISDQKLKAKTLDQIEDLSVRDSPARKPPISVHIKDGIFELRTKFASNIDRIFYFFIYSNKIIMTNGYMKKSQKLDPVEFKKAQKYRNDYISKMFGD